MLEIMVDKYYKIYTMFETNEIIGGFYGEREF